MGTEAAELAKKALEIALEKQASDILLLDLRGQCPFADYFVVCTAESERQIRAISSDIDKLLTDEGVALCRREGNSASGWLLLDFGDIIVHIFAPPQRQYYELDKLWGKAAPVVRIL